MQTVLQPPTATAVVAPGPEPPPVAGYVGWWQLEADALRNAAGEPAADGETIAEWQDISGNDNHFLQGTDASRPIRSDVNGGVQFVNDSMSVAALAIGDCTIFAFVRNDEAGLVNQKMFDGTTASLAERILIDTRDNDDLRLGSHGSFVSLASGANIIRTFDVVGARHETGAGQRLDAGDATVNSGSAASGTTVGWKVGNHQDDSEPFMGTFKEIILYPTALSNADFNTVKAWLAAKHEPPAPPSTLLNGLLRWYDVDDPTQQIDATGGPTLLPSGVPAAGSVVAPNGFPCVNTALGGFTIGGQDFTSPVFSVGFWGRKDDFAAQQRRMVGMGANSAGGNYFEGGSKTGPTMYGRIRDGGANVDADGAVQFAMDTWYCWLYTYDGVNLVGYQNNQQWAIEPAASLTTQTNDEMTIGKRAGQEEYHPGHVATVAVWDRVLTEGERTEFYNSGVNLRYSDLGSGS